MNTLKGAREKWTEVFEDPSLTLASLKARALSQHSNLGTDGIRSVCWKVYLSCLPSLELSTWPSAMNKERERYIQLRKQYIRAIGSEEGSEPDLEVNNPLSLAEDSPWQQFFVDSELKKIIKQDVERTLPDNDYFRSERVQEQLSDILFIYCKINHDVSYRQGMHELLAHVLWVVSSESLDIHSEPTMTSDATLEVIKSVLDSTYIEHDTFALFSSLMSRAKPWYEFSEEGFPGRKSKPTNVPQTQLFGRSETPEQPTGKQTPVIEWSFKIFHQLEKIDNELYLHLRSLEIEPQLFGIRWFRLLFSREFPMDNVLALWDGIFANGPSLDICIFLGVALLLRIREELLEEDFAGCLHKLMRYPSVKDIHQFLPQALRLQKLPNAASGQEVIRQNYALAGKPLPPLPPSHVDSDHQQSEGTSRSHSQRQSHNQHHPQAQHHYQHPQAHSHDPSKGSAFPGNGVLSQHLPPAALDAIKPVAEGFVHVTKNVLESKGGAALNKAINDMKKNTQSYIRKANTHTPTPAPSTFPPMFDQAISSGGRMAATSRPAPSPPKHHHAHGSISDASKQFQSQLGQIVAKALVILDAEFISPPKSGAGTPNSNDSNKPTYDEKEPVKEPSKAALAAICGLEHVRDVLLGSSKEFDPFIIESGMLEKPAQIPTSRSVGNHYHTSPIVNHATPRSQAESQVAGSTSPVPRTLPNASTTASSPSGQVKKGAPARSSMDIKHERRSMSRASSQTNVATESGLQHGTIAVSPASPGDVAPTAPVHTTPPPPPKPFSFDDLIKDTPAEPTRSASPLSSASRGATGAGLGSKTKSPRSSLAHSQFSWMLNDGAEDGAKSGSAASRIGSGGVASSSSSTSLSYATKGSNGGGTARPLGEFSLASSPSLGGHRVKVDPLAGSVSKRSGPGAQPDAGLRSGAVQGQQLQDDDPLRE